MGFESDIMKLAIYSAEGCLYGDDEKTLIEQYPFVHGAVIHNQAGLKIASVGGSDEYTFSIRGVVSCKFIPDKDGPGGDLDVIVEWVKRGVT
jgi:hypothetical protein